MSTLEQISENLIKGKANEVKTLVQQALDEGKNAGEVLNDGLLAGMAVVGERFKKNEIYVPEVLIAARAMKMGTEILKPLLAESGVEPTGKIVLGTVKGDLHDIGKNLVGMMLEGSGFQVIDLGTDVPSQKFVEAARENNATIVGASALLTTTMTAMKEVVDAFKSSDLSGKVKIMIGGAPVTQAFCDEIGADGYAPDAASAADVAKVFVG
jgi:5-methyltetrahydrofolate--homocysteine methyltransferase